jgi:hypothetical protein
MSDNFLRQKSNFQKLEQDFKITSDTTFETLKIGACLFWGEKDPSEFRFYDHKVNEIIGDTDKGSNTIFGNSQEEMTVNKFYETFLFTKAVLILMKPILEQEVMIKEQRESVVIRQEKNAKHNIRKYF